MIRWWNIYQTLGEWEEKPQLVLRVVKNFGVGKKEPLITMDQKQDQKHSTLKVALVNVLAVN